MTTHRSRVAWISVIVLAAVCIGLVACDGFYERHAAFGFADFFGFYPVAGFVAVVGGVFFARLVRPLIGRPENYYGELDPEVEALDSKDDTDG